MPATSPPGWRRAIRRNGSSWTSCCCRRSGNNFPDRLAEGKNLLADASFHRLLADLRRRYDSLSDDDGPFPPEVFPYDLAPELELLQPGSQPAFAPGQEMDAESADFYVQLQLAR